MDDDLSGPQKFHLNSVPRIGGIAIFGAIAATLVIRSFFNPYLNSSIEFILCALPTFTIGLAEDLTKKIGVKVRLVFTAISASLFVYLLKSSITTLDIAAINMFLAYPIISISFTVFAISGLTNAYNIIDGFNGLASMVGLITLLALAYVGYKAADMEVVHLSLIMCSAILGFFIWNYPNGHIFLGDSGAYLIGFWIACLTIFLVSRHPSISPWFAVLINGYPIMETLFSIYRRKIHRGKNPGEPDGIHFHTLIYRRLLNPNRTIEKNRSKANAKTSPYLWILASASIAPAILWSESTIILIMACTFFSCLYVWLYSRIVHFKTPKWLYIY
ncbi:glycosyl transferase [Polynucleobacter paneuropaeus]|nr:glycosyl transferase [Polynucleobacter paneuropaeus]